MADGHVGGESFKGTHANWILNRLGLWTVWLAAGVAGFGADRQIAEYDSTGQLWANGVRLGQSETDGATKLGYLACIHRDSDTIPDIGVLEVSSTGSDNTLNYGQAFGTGTFTGATIHNFWAAASRTVTAAAIRMMQISSQSVLLGENDEVELDTNNAQLVARNVTRRLEVADADRLGRYDAVQTHRGAESGYYDADYNRRGSLRFATTTNGTTSVVLVNPPAGKHFEVSIAVCAVKDQGAGDSAVTASFRARVSMRVTGAGAASILRSPVDLSDVHATALSDGISIGFSISGGDLMMDCSQSTTDKYRWGVDIETIEVSHDDP